MPFDYKNVHVAVVQREGPQDWEGTGRYLSIRAYKNGRGSRLHMGPDTPIGPECSGLPSAEIERVTRVWLEALCGPDNTPNPA